MDTLTAIFSHVCGQGRSFILGGEALPVCQRCFGLYTGAALTGVWLLATGAWRRGLPDLGMILLNSVMLLAAMLGGLQVVDDGPAWRLTCGLWTGHVALLWLATGAREFYRLGGPACRTGGPLGETSPAWPACRSGRSRGLRFQPPSPRLRRPSQAESATAEATAGKPAKANGDGGAMAAPLVLAAFACAFAREAEPACRSGRSGWVFWAAVTVAGAAFLVAGLVVALVMGGRMVLRRLRPACRSGR